MRAIRAAALALTGTAAALVLGAPAADAIASDDDTTDTSFGFTVAPESVEPGGTVTLNATECESPTVTGSSSVFDTVTLSEGLPATATVYEDAKPGAAYDVTFDCLGEKGKATLTISAEASVSVTGVAPVPGIDPTPVPLTPTPDDLLKPDDPLKPDEGVKAGAGGSLSGLSPTQITVGSLLIAGALGGGALLLRRRTGDAA